MQVINEHIIFPEVMIQHAKVIFKAKKTYAKHLIFYPQNGEQGKPQPSSFPRLKIRTGQKFIVEDGNTSQSEGNGVKLLKQIMNLVKCKLFRLIPTEMSIPHLSAGKQEVNKI